MNISSREHQVYYFKLKQKIKKKTECVLEFKILHFVFIFYFLQEHCHHYITLEGTKPSLEYHVQQTKLRAKDQ